MKRPRELVRPLSVLVVDGYPDAATSLALVLTTEGFAARIALCGGEAAAAAAAEPPDVVVFEPRTPGGGWELLRRLAEPVAGKRPFLVALTTDTTAVGREAADALGAGLYLIKPENPAVLVRALRRLGQAVNESVPGAAEPIARRGGGGGGAPPPPPPPRHRSSRRPGCSYPRRRLQKCC
jgi:two-component system, OmpR family, response regulator